VDNPVQAGGAVRGREWLTTSHNHAGVELSVVHCCAPTEHRDRALHRFTPSCASLALGYQKFASSGGLGWWATYRTAALGYCLNRFALSERGLLKKIINN